MAHQSIKKTNIFIVRESLRVLQPCAPSSSSSGMTVRAARLINFDDPRVRCISVATGGVATNERLGRVQGSGITTRSRHDNQYIDNRSMLQIRT